ncbi:MAG TPA: hypothetical protein VJN94_18170 [Candidatus Binataceae bacterium]|nr:hypothetical protein [Candidatus Binataceae bacterium]
MLRRTRIPIILVLLYGCFYPPQQKPLPASRTAVTLKLPYDLAWDAVHKVVEHNDYRIITENPDDGTIEAQAVGGFSIADADCGKLKGVGGKYSAEPSPDSSAIYDFQVKPTGDEAATVEIVATFTAPVDVPLHRARGEQCASRGTQEASLLREISRQARQEHRPEFKPAPMPLPARETVE